jgi:hypothetical protein
MFPARLIFAIFVVLQLADGLITAAAVAMFGPAVEANQLIATWMALIGPVPAVVGAKLLACACGGVLFFFQGTRVLAGLTLLYVFGAVIPWLNTIQTLSTP